MYESRGHKQAYWVEAHKYDRIPRD
jgi:hypothetical protein